MYEVKIYTKSHERLSLFLSVVELRYKKINEYKLEHATALLRTKDRKIERDQRRPKNERKQKVKNDGMPHTNGNFGLFGLHETFKSSHIFFMDKVVVAYLPLF